MFGKFVSMGWFCGTAASMAKYGLRSGAGPFDWCFTELAELLELIDSGFVDFLDKQNLETDKNNPKTFRDLKYKITFFHDVKEDLETDYDAIYDKYSRRIRRLKELHQSKVQMCFIRAVHNEAELQYICENAEYINSVIKKYNQKNEIVFLVPRCFGMPECTAFKFFEIQIDKYNGSDEDDLRELFDTNLDFVHWCNANSSLKGRFLNIYWQLKKKIRNRKSKKEKEET